MKLTRGSVETFQLSWVMVTEVLLGVSNAQPWWCEVSAEVVLGYNLDTALGCAAPKPASLVSTPTKSLLKLYQTFRLMGLS